MNCEIKKPLHIAATQSHPTPAYDKLDLPGDALIAIDEENTERMSRLQILKQLENCRGIEVRVGDATRCLPDNICAHDVCPLVPQALASQRMYQLPLDY